MSATLVVLARVPAPGQGKTRLRRLLPPPAVDAIAAAMVSDTLAWAGSTTGFGHLLVAHRGVPGPRLRAEAAQARWVKQPEGDLGTRIEAALHSAFGGARGGEVVQIGTDSPSLPDSLLAAARTALASADASLIPADDGGWIALGVTRPLHRALAGVPWSSRSTLQDTVAALTGAGLPPALLASHYDIDEAADLLRLADDPASPARAPRTLEAIAPLLSRLREVATEGPPESTLR